MVCAVALALVAGVVAHAGTAGYWRFEDEIGSLVPDSGPNGLDGTVEGTAFYSSDTPVDPVPVNNLANTSSLDLNWQDAGNSGFVTVPEVDFLLTMGNQLFTVEAWVKLDQLSDTSDNDQRQYLCQKKRLPATDSEMDYALLVQRGDSDEPTPNYGKQDSFSGRELQLIFGDPTASTWSITSHLEINDLDWHLVSLAFDPVGNVVRFGIDDVFETVAFEENPRSSNNGPLRIGSYQSDSGLDSFFLRGAVDEFRVSRAFLPPEQLLNAPLQDCNGNGVSDFEDIFDGTSGDCNENQLPDECEIVDGTSEDCQPDGEPDECQLEQTLELSHDNDIPGVGWRSDYSFTGWLNRFNVQGGAGVVEAIDVKWGIVPLGTEVNVHVWSDPNGDGDPTDAVALWSSTTTVELIDFISRIDVPDISVGETGASFFVGFTMPVTDPYFPAQMDISGVPVPDRSWGVGSNLPIDPDDLSANAIEFGTIDDLLFAGNWILRAHMKSPGNDCNDNATPDDCDIAGGTSSDVDGNGMPDGCDDCNGNGTLDSLDIAGGTSFDCNGDGMPDECQLASGDCNNDGVPDVCQLDGNDCNGNAIPDGCDINSGLSADIDGSGSPDDCEDCNGNGAVDGFDISLGVSVDCNEDGLPDECQLGEPIATMSYAYDDGTAESVLTIIPPVWDTAWLQRFTVQPGGEWVSAIQVVWGDTYPGLPAKAVLWADPDGDGDPTDAQVLVAVDTETANVSSNVYNTIEIPPTYVGTAGTSFFVGMFYSAVYGSAPIALDHTEPSSGEAWFALNDLGTLDLNDLAALNLISWSSHDFMLRAVGFDGELEYDCNASTSLDSCEIQSGESSDCNLNDTPDECDLSGGGSIDCNGNTLPDECDTACTANCDGDGDQCVDDVDRDPFDPNVCSDTDGDGCDDCSSGAFNPSGDGLDSDSDGYCDVGDCNSGNPDVWSVPGSIENLILNQTLATRLNWGPPSELGATAVVYDTLRSTLATDFDAAATCLSSDRPGTVSTDAEDPVSGVTFYYLIRVENDCIGENGSMGADSNGVPRSGMDCP